MPTLQWSTLEGQTVSLLAVCPNANRYLEVFAKGSDNAVWRNYQTSSSDWNGWESLGGEVGNLLTVARHPNGRLTVFAQAADNTIRRKWQLPDGNWSDWKS